MEGGRGGWAGALLEPYLVPTDATQPRDHLLMAASLLMVLPMIILFFAAQRYFVRGIVMSGIKG